MKRGLISWDRALLPPSAFDARLAAIHHCAAVFDVPAVVAYSDVWRSNDVRYISNYMPYWNRAFAVVPRGEKPMLLCSLSPRVYPWIKSVTIHEVIVPSPNPPAQLRTLCDERGWSRVGLLDRAGLPHDLHTQLTAEKIDIVDIPRDLVRNIPTEPELAMHRHAVGLARAILRDSLTTAAIGLTDHQFAGELERKFRRGGAEDLFIWMSDGHTPPLPAMGNAVNEYSSVAVALEYSGHWVQLSRNVAGVTAVLPPSPGATVHLETLSGPYSWEGIASLEDVREAVVAVHVEVKRGGFRLYYGDTCLKGPDRFEVL